MKLAGLLAVLVAAGLVSGLIVLPLLGGGLPPLERGAVGADAGAANDADRAAVDPATTAGAVDLVTVPSPTLEAPAAFAQEHEEAVEGGVDDGIELVQAQGVEVSQEQREAALEGARASAAQHQEADAEQVQAATAGAVHGALVQAQGVNATQLQVAVGGATDGALAQHQRANATQLQSATWGATHGAVAQALSQQQEITVEQIQVATSGAAAGAAHEAGEKDIDEIGTIQEAAQGSAYGVIEQYQKLTVEQRQRVTLEHVQHAAAGAAAGALEGSQLLLEQEQIVDVEQYQRVTIKQVQTAAMGAAKGALVQTQQVTVEQTQSAAFGAAKGTLVQVQIVHIEQVQKITVTQLQEAAFGAAKGAIVQSQAATVEQIQAAALGAAGGTLVQHQEVSVVQVQRAATGAAKGAVESAVQHQVVEVEQIQAAAHGAGAGAVTQIQIVNVVQVQVLAQGASSGALSQAQVATVEQIQAAAKGACEAAARQSQLQRVSVTQLQVATADAAAETATGAADAGLETEIEIAAVAEADAVEAFETVEEREETAAITLRDRESDGETVVVDRIELSDGGFVAIHDETFADDPVESVRGVSAYLEAGTHEDVEIELEEPLGASQSVLAVAHLETTEDETFTYVESEGLEDEPYVDESGAAVADRAVVTLETEAVVEEPLIEEPAEEVEEPEVATPEEPEEEIEEIPEEEVAEPPEEEVNESPEEEVEEPPEEEIEEPDLPPEASLTVFDQVGDGETLPVEAASASVEYVLVVADDEGEQLAESEPFAADEPVESVALELDPPLEATATLEVEVVAADEEGLPADEAPVLASETIEYALEASLVFEDQEGDGESVLVTEAFLPEGGFVAIHDERLLEELDDPGDLEDTTNETLRETVIGVSERLEPGDHENVSVDLFDVPGVESEDERLADGDHRLVAVAFQDTAGDEVDDPYLDADGALITADAVVAVVSDAGFAVELAETNAPVAVGENLEVTAVVANEGTEAATETVSLALDGATVDSTEVSLEPGEATELAFSVETADLEAGSYTVLVESETESDETTVELEPASEDDFADADEPALLTVTDLSAPDTATAGETISVTATVTNDGDLAATDQVVYRIDGETVSESTVSLEGGESVELSFSVPIPTTAAAGASTHEVATSGDEEQVTIELLSAEELAALV